MGTKQAHGLRPTPTWRLYCVAHSTLLLNSRPLRVAVTVNVEQPAASLLTVAPLPPPSTPLLLACRGVGGFSDKRSRLRCRPPCIVGHFAAACHPDVRAPITSYVLRDALWLVLLPRIISEVADGNGGADQLRVEYRCLSDSLVSIRTLKYLSQQQPFATSLTHSDAAAADGQAHMQAEPRNKHAAGLSSM